MPPTRMPPTLRPLQAADTDALVAPLPDLGYAFARGYERVRLRSNVIREGARAFYEHLGFEKSKASYAFELRRPT